LGPLGSRFAWLSDEWYLIAGLPLPPRSAYEDLPQQENGVGTIRAFLDALDQATRRLPERLAAPRRVSWVVGQLVAGALSPVVERLNAVDGLELILHGLPSPYWGQDQVVTGLLTGSDLLLGLADKDLGDQLLLPSVLLRQGEPVFLDDMSLEQFAAQCPVPIELVAGADDSWPLVWAAKGLSLSSVGTTDLFGVRPSILAITALAGMALVPAVARPGWSQEAEAPAQDPPAQEAGVPQSTGIPLAPQVVGERPLSDPSVLAPAATELSPALQPLAAPPAPGFAGHAQSGEDSGTETPGAERCRNPGRGQQPQPQSGRLPGGSGEIKPQGPDLALVPQHQPQHQQQLSALNNSYRFQSDLVRSGTEGIPGIVPADPGNTASAGGLRFGAQMNVGINWDLINPQRVPQIARARDHSNRPRISI